MFIAKGRPPWRLRLWPLLVGVLTYLPAMLSGTLISNVNLVFETFDPVSMVRFFEFNDKGWNISAGCIQDMFYYLDGLHRDISWAMRLYDASGYYAGGLLDGNYIRSGNPGLCRHLNAEHLLFSTTRPPTTAVPPQSTPRSASAMPTAPLNASGARQPFAVQLVVARYTLHLDDDMLLVDVVGGIHSRLLTVAQTVCMPQSCGLSDLQQVMSYAQLPHMRNAVHVQHAELAAVRLVGGGAYVLWSDMSFIVLCATVTVIVALMLIAAIYECFTKHALNRKTPDDMTIPERFTFAAKTSSFIAHVDIDKISKLSGCETDSTTSRNLNGSDQLLDSLIINNFAIPTPPEKQDNIVQAKSLELQQQSKQSPDHRTKDVWNNTGCHNKAASSDSPSESSLAPTVILSTDGLLSQLIGAFSWHRNWCRLFATACDSSVADSIEDDVRVVSGLKVACGLSIVLVHVCVFLVHVSSNKHVAKQSDLVSVLLSNGSITIDVYFFLSGISMAHIFYTTARVINVHQICGAFEQMLLFASMILYKLIRLTFPYLIVLILLQLTMKHFHDHGLLEIPSEDHVTCQEHMWKNILYIDTFFPVTERCMVWSWYISLEAQLCLGASIILLLAQTHPRYASVISASFFTSSIVTSTILRYNQRTSMRRGGAQQMFGAESESFVNIAAEYEKELIDFNGVYDQPWTRISPYLLGLCLGYILHRTKRQLKMHIVVVILGWLACVSLIVGFALKQLFVLKLSAWIRAGLASTTHIVWSTILFWIVLASVSQHGGPLGRALLSERWRPLGKLTTCVLLVHPLVTRGLLLSMEHSVHMSDSLLVIAYVGIVVIVYVVGFMLYMLFEAPFAAVFHILYDRNFR